MVAQPPSAPSSTEPLAERKCLVCGTQVKVTLAPWTARCPDCGTWTSALEPEIGRSSEFDIDAGARVVGLRELRERNFMQVLDRLSAVSELTGANVLDVGCAYGWFIAAAGRRGANAIGVEPDERIAAQAREDGHEVLTGFFPDATREAGQMDVIAFNDVLEHIPDAAGVLAACVEQLRPGGILSVNIPTSDGLGYRTSSLLARAGIHGPYRRFWQANLPSPHVHYFPRRALVELVRSAGFEIVDVAALIAITHDGLWERIHTVRPPSAATVLDYLALRIAIPVLNRPGSSDIVHVIARRPA